MPEQSAAPIEIDPAAVGTLELAGLDVPYVDLEEEPQVHTRLRVGDVEYLYERSFPITGHSAVMPAAIAEMMEEQDAVLVVERTARYFVYLGTS